MTYGGCLFRREAQIERKSALLLVAHRAAGSVAFALYLGPFGLTAFWTNSNYPLVPLGLGQSALRLPFRSGFSGMQEFC